MDHSDIYIYYVLIALHIVYSSDISWGSVFQLISYSNWTDVDEQY